MGKAPEVCRYCDGQGNSSAGGSCGFCDNGTPLDTQEDWDRTWGAISDRVAPPSDGGNGPDEPHG